MTRSIYCGNLASPDEENDRILSPNASKKRIGAIKYPKTFKQSKNYIFLSDSFIIFSNPKTAKNGNNSAKSVYIIDGTLNFEKYGAK